MADAQKKTVPFPNMKKPPDGLPKDIPTVNMVHPMAPLVEKFAVPFAWFVFGGIMVRVFWPRTKHVSFKSE